MALRPQHHLRHPLIATPPSLLRGVVFATRLPSLRGRVVYLFLAVVLAWACPHQRRPALRKVVSCMEIGLPLLEKAVLPPLEILHTGLSHPLQCPRFLPVPGLRRMGMPLSLRPI